MENGFVFAHGWRTQQINLKSSSTCATTLFSLPKTILQEIEIIFISFSQKTTKFNKVRIWTQALAVNTPPFCLRAEDIPNFRCHKRDHWDLSQRHIFFIPWRKYTYTVMKINITKFGNWILQITTYLKLSSLKSLLHMKCYIFSHKIS